MSQGTRRRHRKHANPFTVRGPLDGPPLEELYGRVAPLALEIGFGRGRFLLEVARRNPQWNVLGIEIRQHLVDGVMAAARQEGLPNVHAVLANANIHLRELVPARSVAFVAINFPDPWYKKRHHKRRVVCAGWLDALVQKLMTGAEIHAMSDYEPVAVEMRDLLEAQAGLENLDGCGRFAQQSTTGVSSEREEKHLARGDPVFRLRFRFREGPGPTDGVAIGLVTKS